MVKKRVHLVVFVLRTCFYAIYFFCAFQAVLSTTIPWAKLSVAKAGNTRIVYTSVAKAAADTAEALIQLVDADALASAHRETSSRNEVEVLFVNMAYFVTGAPSPKYTFGDRVDQSKRPGRWNNT